MYRNLEHLIFRIILLQLLRANEREYNNHMVKNATNKLANKKEIQTPHKLKEHYNRVNLYAKESIYNNLTDNEIHTLINYCKLF